MENPIVGLRKRSSAIPNKKAGQMARHFRDIGAWF